ncbi:MAG: type II secretion system protein [Tissierellia bacterium]|nr:type II secretion system protein [Tissierellia bacterium]
MKKKGFLLIEILMGLFLLGIVSVTCLPILNAGIDNIKLNRKKVDMVFIAESTIEQIKSFENTWDEDEYLFHMPLIDLMELFSNQSSVSITLPSNLEESSQYKCTIYKENFDKNLWKIHIIISPTMEDNRVKDVSIWFFMPVPKKDRIK